MGIVRKDFLSGRIDKDTDERIVKGYRHAENVMIINSEGSDMGSAQNAYSNKQQTNLDLGENIKTFGWYADEYRDKLYWLCKSDSGCYFIEWDNPSQTSSFILKDTRPLNTRVFSLKDGYLCTGIEKIINTDINDDLILLTDDNMEPLCINPERAKGYGENGFEKEDIYLIKKPPRFAPSAQLTYSDIPSNNIEEKFLSFAYRYQYLDGEWSALSSFTNPKFEPKPYDFNYYTFDNNGMINAFNSVRIGLNTGDKRVVAIQCIYKESGKNNFYIIETFNKEKLGWLDNLEQFFTFSNDKKYTILPDSEITRSFDNVPLKAKALALIGNTPVFGNYTEGFDLVDLNDEKIKIDYNVSLKSEPLNVGDDFSIGTGSPADTNFINITNSLGFVFKKGFKITFNIIVALYNDAVVFNNSFQYILEEDYDSLSDVFNDDIFDSFLATINSNFATSYLYTPPAGWVKISDPVISKTITSDTICGFTISDAVFEDTFNSNATELVPFKFSDSSSASLSEVSSANSCKSNRNLECAIMYLDGFGRKTIALTAIENSIYIPNSKSEYKNSLQIAIRNNPPKWADRFKILVKSEPLTYQTITVNNYYTDGPYVWIKLEGSDKDKVKEGNYLILKRTPNGIQDAVIKTKILELGVKQKDFISGNINQSGVSVSEPAGVYMKIKPNGFSMNFNDNTTLSSSIGTRASYGFPFVYLDLFSSINGTPPPLFDHLPLSAGSEITLRLVSKFNYDSGWSNIEYLKSFTCIRDYTDIEEWFDEVFASRSMIANTGVDYRPFVSIVTGIVTLVNNALGPYYILTPDPLGKKYLWVVGLESAGTKGRGAFVEAYIDVRLSPGDYVFETEPAKTLDIDVYNETADTYEIIDGNHQGNVQNQDVSLSTACIIDSDFFNCYAHGNGVESYIIKDSFNKPALAVDTRATSTSIEEYRQVVRFSDLTYGEPYVESTNVNGLNVFNLGKANFKELDKQYGSIQKLHSRDGDILVLQEEKASKVMFGKDALYNGDGSVNVTSIPEVLGQQLYYMGENGIGKNPESFAVNDFQIYYANSRRGVIQRLSIDGVTNITTGMRDYFRDLFIAKPNSIKIGGYDPYHNQYYITALEEIASIIEISCGNSIFKSNVSEPFVYIIKHNNIGGDVTIQYEILGGNVDISATNGISTSSDSNVTGEQSLVVTGDSEPRDITVTITPITDNVIDYSASNLCPAGTPLKIVSIILGDANDDGKTINNRFKWNTSPYYNNEDLFLSTPVTRVQGENGIEGVGKFPVEGALVTMQSYKTASNTGIFDIGQCNRLGYFISETVYDEVNIDDLLAAATFLTVTEEIEGITNQVNKGSFLFSRTNEDEILYLIWDYTDRMPITVNDNAVVNQGEFVVINPLANDTPNGTVTITITEAPVNGTAVVNLDNTITYTHDDSATTTDTFKYKISNGVCESEEATVSIVIVSSEGEMCYRWILTVTSPPGVNFIYTDCEGDPQNIDVFYGSPEEVCSPGFPTTEAPSSRWNITSPGICGE